jgi:hypothetical protein
MGARIPFVRTPKTSGPNPTRAEAFGAAIRGSALETTIATALVAVLLVTMWRWGIFAGRAVGLSSATLLVWLGYYALAYGAALALDYSSRRGAPPTPRENSATKTHTRRGSVDRAYQTAPFRSGWAASDLRVAGNSPRVDSLRSGRPATREPEGSGSRTA